MQAIDGFSITASGGVSNNYDFAYTEGTLTVTKATLTVAAENKTKVYGAANPSLSFASEANTGIYRSGSNAFNISIVGTDRLEVNATGLEITGTGTFSGGVLGGIFT